jgi:hypothetical protein
MGKDKNPHLVRSTHPEACFRVKSFFTGRFSRTNRDDTVAFA